MKDIDILNLQLKKIVVKKDTDGDFRVKVILKEPWDIKGKWEYKALLKLNYINDDEYILESIV